MKHTPGPWHYQEGADEYTHIVRGPKDEFISSTPQGTDGEDRANARLIAAAPDMLEALEAALGALQMECPECDGCQVDLCTQCRAKAAIRKATAVDSEAVSTSKEKDK